MVVKNSQFIKEHNFIRKKNDIHKKWVCENRVPAGKKVNRIFGKNLLKSDITKRLLTSFFHCRMFPCGIKALDGVNLIEHLWVVFVSFSQRQTKHLILQPAGQLSACWSSSCTLVTLQIDVFRILGRSSYVALFATWSLSNSKPSSSFQTFFFWLRCFLGSCLRR